MEKIAEYEIMLNPDGELPDTVEVWLGKFPKPVAIPTSRCVGGVNFEVESASLLNDAFEDIAGMGVDIGPWTWGQLRDALVGVMKEVYETPHRQHRIDLLTPWQLQTAVRKAGSDVVFEGFKYLGCVDLPKVDMQIFASNKDAEMWVTDTRKWTPRECLEGMSIEDFILPGEEWPVTAGMQPTED